MMIVKKRYIFIFLPIMLLLLGAGTALFFFAGQKDGDNMEKRGIVLKNSSAVPVDAIAIFNFRDLSVTRKIFIDSSSLFSLFLSEDNPLYKLIEIIGKNAADFPSLKESSKSEVLFSLHYSAKEDVSLLFCLDLSDGKIDKDLFIHAIKNLYPQYTKRSFSTGEICILDGIQFSIYKNTFIASTSSIVLESSLRHLASGSSIMDNPDFAKILKESVDEDNILFINNQQTGKFFSGVIDRQYWGLSDFFSKVGSWTILKADSESNIQRYTGVFANLKGVGNFSTCFNNLKGNKFEAWKILPGNTLGVLSIPLKDYSRFFNRNFEYKELYKNLDDKSVKIYKDWFLSLDPQEVAIALVPYNGTLESITLIRTKTPQEQKFEKFIHKGALNYLFGGIFSCANEEFYCCKGNWIIIGRKDIINEYAISSFPGVTMEVYLSQSELYPKIMKEETLVSVIINVSAKPESFAGIFKPSIKKSIAGSLAKRNFEVIVYQLYNADPGVKMNLLLNAEQMKSGQIKD